MRSPGVRRAAVLLLVVAAMLLAGAPAGAAEPRAAHSPIATVTDPVRRAAPGGLAAALDRILADPRLAGATAGVVVRDADGGTLLYSREGERRLVPASNQKLLTSAAALEVLGPGYRFTTEVHAAGSRHGGELRGDLYLRGSGDPALLPADLDRLAAAVAADGVTSVSGRLVADDTWFDGVRLGDDWAWDDEEYGYAAPVSALTVAPGPRAEPGSVTVEVRPGVRPGRPAAVRLLPASGQTTIVNRAVTSTADATPDVTVTREHGTSTMVVGGTVPAGGAPRTFQRSVQDPTGHVLEVFARALADHGVTLLGGTGRGATPSSARRLAAHTSPPLRELLTPMLKLSRNGYAEALVKAMGRTAAGQGSWAAGLAAATAALEGLGVDTATLRAADGSGLSRKNLVAPEHLAELLMEAEEEPWFQVWSAALPVAGAPDPLTGGTLSGRLRGTPAAGRVHAKTGTLTSASALSGYVTTISGHHLAFSILLNNYLGDAPKHLEDQIMVELATAAPEKPAPQAA